MIKTLCRGFAILFSRIKQNWIKILLHIIGISIAIIVAMVVLLIISCVLVLSIVWLIKYNPFNSFLNHHPIGIVITFLGLFFGYLILDSIYQLGKGK